MSFEFCHQVGLPFVMTQNFVFFLCMYLPESVRTLRSKQQGLLNLTEKDKSI